MYAEERIPAGTRFLRMGAEGIKELDVQIEKARQEAEIKQGHLDHLLDQRRIMQFHQCDAEEAVQFFHSFSSITHIEYVKNMLECKVSLGVNRIIICMGARDSDTFDLPEDIRSEEPENGCVSRIFQDRFILWSRAIDYDGLNDSKMYPEGNYKDFFTGSYQLREFQKFVKEEIGDMDMVRSWNTAQIVKDDNRFSVVPVFVSAIVRDPKVIEENEELPAMVFEFSDSLWSSLQLAVMARKKDAKLNGKDGRE